MLTKEKSNQIYIFAGEPSGDLHGSHLMLALKLLLDNKISFRGIGGPRMRALGLQSVLQMEDFSVMGFSDVFLALPNLVKQFYLVRDDIIKMKPQMVVLIDYPGFNLRLAKALRKKGYQGRIVQYICPTVWAWGKNRISKMAETLDLLLTIFPFESSYFSDTSLPVSYVGHPLQMAISDYNYDTSWQAICGIKKSEQLVAIFPGSREGEIVRNLPKQLLAAELLRKDQPDVTFAISYGQGHMMSRILEIIGKTNLKIHRDVFLVPNTYTYELMKDSRSAIAKSGTVTLELALHKRPTVVIYEMTIMNKIIAKYILQLNLDHYCIVNIIGKKTIFPELIKESFTPQRLYQEIKSLHCDEERRSICIADCQNIQNTLEGYNASARAAEKIAELLSV